MSNTDIGEMICKHDVISYWRAFLLAVNTTEATLQKHGVTGCYSLVWIDDIIKCHKDQQKVLLLTI